MFAVIFGANLNKMFICTTKGQIMKQILVFSPFQSPSPGPCCSHISQFCLQGSDSPTCKFWGQKCSFAHCNHNAEWLLETLQLIRPITNKQHGLNFKHFLKLNNSKSSSTKPLDEHVWEKRRTSLAEVSSLKPWLVQQRQQYPQELLAMWCSCLPQH